MGGLFEYIKMAVQNIRANKGRSFPDDAGYYYRYCVGYCNRFYRRRNQKSDEQ